MGYTVFALPEPVEQISNGIHGPESRMVTPATVYPSSFVQRLFTQGRYELWEDTRGVASIQDVDAVMPGWLEQLDRNIRNEGAKSLRKIATPYMDEERETWQDQKQEALAWSIDPATPTPMIDQMATERGIPKDVLMEKILQNVTAFRPASGKILGIQQRLLDQLYAATTVADRLAVTWEVTK